MTAKLISPATSIRLCVRPCAASLLLRLAMAGGCATLALQCSLAQAAGTTNSSSQTTLSRAVRVKVSRGSLFRGAMMATGMIDLKGNNISADSFDSSNPLASTNGQYDPAKAANNGDVYTNLGITNSMNVGNANIYGHAHTGPGGGIDVGPNGAVGEYSWQASNSGIEPGWASDDSNFTFPDTALPYSSGLTPASGNIVTATGTTVSTNTQTSTSYPSPTPPNGVTTNITSYTTVSTYPSPVPTGLTTNTSLTTSSTYPAPVPLNLTTNVTVSKNGKISYTYTWPVYTYTYPNLSFTYALTTTNTIYTTNFYDHILYSGDYYATSLGGATIVLGQARLVLPNGLVQANKDSFTVGPSGSVTVYSDGTSCIIGNGGGVNNQNGLAAGFELFCTPNVKNFSMTGQASFVGVLVAPSATVTMSGSGNITVDFSGSLIANSVKMNGHYKFHFDQALNQGGNGRYLVTSWNEIAVSN